jgi:hypothetical protein
MKTIDLEFTEAGNTPGYTQSSIGLGEKLAGVGTSPGVEATSTNPRTCSRNDPCSSTATRASFCCPPCRRHEIADPHQSSMQTLLPVLRCPAYDSGTVNTVIGSIERPAPARGDNSTNTVDCCVHRTDLPRSRSTFRPRRVAAPPWYFSTGDQSNRLDTRKILSVVTSSAVFTRRHL